MNNEQLHKIRHSAAHLLAYAVRELYPNAKVAIGPVIDTGFYYDFDFGAEQISEEDLPKIEKKMEELRDTDFDFEQSWISVDEAKDHFRNEPYKLEIISEIESGKRDDFEQKGNVGIYKSGKFVDLCKGPHIENSKEIKVFKLMSLAGAYWKGDEKNKMLTRIYGTAFESESQLNEYLELLEEAKRRDHKKLGKELELFMFHETSPGMPYWLPKGLKLYNELVNYWREEHDKYGYQEISSPLLNKTDLYVTSGHWDHYKDDMFIADMGENEVYGIKPMNCPNAMLVFGSKTRSYKDLPLRLSDTDKLHRYERSGTLNGLLRVRSFQQDDSHNYVSEDMIESEYEHVFELCQKFYAIFGLDYYFRLGTRPESYLGDEATWDKAEDALKRVLANSGKDYFILDGDGAFYGPKVDILMKDSLGREWQMGTIQLDFQQPDRFNLKYIDQDGKEKTPVCIHRVIYGSLERFIGIIIEHFAGSFPVWISPVQVAVIPISEKSNDYAKSVGEELAKAGIRYEIDENDETMSNKIRKAQEQKVPYMLILGEREAAAGTVSVRDRSGNQQNGISLSDFTDKVRAIIISKSLEI